MSDKDNGEIENKENGSEEIGELSDQLGATAGDSTQQNSDETSDSPTDIKPQPTDADTNADTDAETKADTDADTKELPDEPQNSRTQEIEENETQEKTQETAGARGPDRATGDKTIEERRSLRNKRTAQLGSLTRKRNELVELMSDDDNLSLIKSDFEELNRRYVEYKRQHDNYLSVLSEEEVEEEENKFATKQLNYMTFKDQVANFIRECEGRLTAALDDASQLASRSRRSRSIRSTSAKSVRSQRLSERAKIAALQVEKEMLKKKYALKVEEENLQLELKLAKAQAREKVLASLEEDAEDDQDGTVPNRGASVKVLSANKSEMRKEVPRKPAKASEDFRSSRTSNPQPFDDADQPSARPKADEGASNTFKSADAVFQPARSSLNASAAEFVMPTPDVSSQVLGMLSLPHQELTKFKGDIIEYRAFIMGFEARVASKLTSSIDKLFYLDNSLLGDAKDLISGCLDINPDEGYLEARNLLEKEYGDPYKIGMVYLQKIQKWDALKADDCIGLKRFSVFLSKCKTAMNSISYLNVLNHPPNMLTIVQKLPMYLQNKWRERASKMRMERSQVMQFTDLAAFVSLAAETANDPVYGRSSGISENKNESKHSKNPKPGSKPGSKPKSSSFVTSVSTENKTEKKHNVCDLCKQHHHLDACKEFNKKSLNEKQAFIRENSLCFGCFGRNHVSKGCRVRLRCSTCNKRHPTSLHVDEPDDTKGNIDSKNKVENSSCTATDVHSSHTLHAIIPVKIYQRGQDRAITTYAFYDDGSSGCFITNDLKTQMSAVGVDTVLQLKTMHGCNRSPSVVLENLVVTDMNGENALQLPRTYTREEIPVNTNQIPRPSVVRRWKHLQRIANKIPEYMENLGVGILIGSNCPVALEPLEIIPTEGASPYALRLRHGWTVHGPSSVKNGLTDDLVSHRVVVKELESHKEILAPSVILKMFEADFDDRRVEAFPGEKGMSQEDKRFLQILDEGTSYQDGHYTMPLPFRNDAVSLPNNRSVAVKRALSQKKKMKNNPQYFSDYKVFMDTLFEKGYAEESTSNETSNGKTWFLPHHGVYNVNKPGKIRVVFDCSSSFMGSSLNGCLLQGPDLTSSLVGVLTRFQKGSVAFMADVESMFYQVHVPPDQRSFLKFLWWPNGNLDVELKEYQMTVHIFGATSSPSVANFALRKAGQAFGDKSVCSTIQRNFYVDDCLKAVASEEGAQLLIHNLRNTCAKGGFNLTKFTSNSSEVLQNIPREHHSKELQKCSLGSDDLPIERALGVQWDIQSDKFGFTIAVKDKPATRRGILSIVSSVYDPLGFVAPVILPAKKILQDLCRQNNLGWDDEIPSEQLVKWRDWISDLPTLEKLGIDRNLSSQSSGEMTLLAFSDASSTGYGSVIYLRCGDGCGDYKVHFMIGKARLAPIKATTIPRLELTAAVTSVRLAQLIKCELDEEVTIEYFTDSTTVLHYISSDSRRWPIFVSNRVQLIRDFSSPTQWHYVPSEYNPADEASRGLSASEFVSSSYWLSGPEFLQSEIVGDLWTPPGSEEEVHEENPMTVAVSESSQSIDAMEKIVNHFSDWFRLKKTVAVFLKVQEILLDRVKQKHAQTQQKISDGTYKLFTEDIKKAECEILKWLQWQAFPAEMKQLSSFANDAGNGETTWSRESPTLPKSSSLRSLDPFCYQGLLRVGGRLRRAQMANSMKYPIILPKKSHITSLIIRNEHGVLGHAGRNHVLSNLRQKYWVINANSAVRNVIFSCVACRKLRRPVEEQKMSDLPSCRLDDTVPPFSYTGVDYFGPFMIREKRKELKYYGVLFTCLVSRAVHIEVSHSLDTDSFLHALRRFIARRGNIIELHSDNGSNFVGAHRELHAALEELDQSKLDTYLQRLEISWKFNPPVASHMGGTWERQVRTVRKVLGGLLQEHGTRLDLESFQTLLCEVEAIINSRPLTAYSGDPKDMEPLTPNHILTGRSHVTVPPPGVFERNDLYMKKRWRRVQYLSNLFWSRWKNEYLLLQQRRSKWTGVSRSLSVGDIVLLKDDSAARSSWPMGKVIEAEPDSNGQVRAVKVKTQTSELRRPVSKLILLVPSD